jgi:F-type H+/Na+-transporting ATPase subunit alpha
MLTDLRAKSARSSSAPPARMSTLLQEIEAQISGLKTGVTKQNVGTVREIGDGVAKIEGLSDAMLNEMLDFGGGVIGLALNLEETEVGAIILGDYTASRKARKSAPPASCSRCPSARPCSAASSTPSASPSTAKGPIKTRHFYPVEKIAPGIIKRKSVSQPVQTGIMAIDAMIPIGRGQRELIIGDRATGKTTIGIDTIISQARINRENEGQGRLPPALLHLRRRRPEAIQRRPRHRRAGRSRRDALHHHRQRQRLRFRHQPIPRALRRRAMGEWFMDNGMDALIIYDDLSKHAVAYRQVSLISSAPRAAKPIPATSFICTAACSNAPRASARNTATARSPRCPSSKRRPATSRPTSRPTSSPSPTARFTWKPICSTRASAPPFRSVSPSRASVPPRRSRP